MKRFIEFLSREPAMAVAVVLAALNMVTTLNAEQTIYVQTIVETIIVLFAGGVVRQNVYAPATVDEIRKGIKP